MPHDPTKVAMGTTVSNIRTVTEEKGDPATFKAGLFVRRASGETGLQLAAGSNAALIGVSLGSGLIDIKRTAVAREGLGIPVLLEDDSTPASRKIGDITYTSKLRGTEGNAISITLVDDTEDGSANVEVDGLDIIVNIETGVTVAEDISLALAAHDEAFALIDAEVDSGDEDVAQSAASKQNLTGGDNGDSHITEGGVVEINTTTGKATESGTETGAVYSKSGALTGVYEDGTTARVALIDMLTGP
jgi:hypothetical protein